MTTTKNPKAPTHTIFQVIGEGEQARWIRIGAGWANKDGKGLSLRFDAYPATGRTVIRENADDTANARGQQ